MNDDNKNTPAAQLHDLIQILAERTLIYSAAISSADTERDVKLIAFLQECMQLNQQFKSELNGILAKEDCPFSEQDWTAGSLYLRWQERHPAKTSIEREQILAVCEKAEDAMLLIFEEVLANSHGFTENTTAVIKSQASLQKQILGQLSEAKESK